MGQDKALMPFNGTPLIKRIHDRFSGIGQETILITNSEKGYTDFGLPTFQDIIPDRGALGGLYTALSFASETYVGLIAADLPFASKRLILKLLELAQTSEADAALPSTEYGLEPMHAVYKRETCLPLVKNALEQNQWKMIAWHEHAKVKVLGPQETRRAAGTNYTFENVNTPKDFLTAEKLAAENPDL
jgi:molybdopterin-guanine dinucleotide biosynthesis protein A